MCITIDIVDDAAVENTESFTVSLSRTGGLDSRVQLRQPTSTIEIIDDDNHQSLHYFPQVPWLVSGVYF